MIERIVYILKTVSVLNSVYLSFTYLEAFMLDKVLISNFLFYVYLLFVSVL